MRVCLRRFPLCMVGTLFAVFIAGCTERPPDIKLLDHAHRLPPNASVEKLQSSLPDILAGIRQVPRRDIGIVREVTIKLREQPNVAEAFAKYYDSLSTDHYSERRLVLSVAGELQRTDLLDLFKRVTWTPLPDTQAVPDGLSPRDREVMLQMKAVECIGFVRNEDGTLNTDAVDELMKIMREHTSRSVRINAIDTYMWNHVDSAEAATELKQILDAEWHKFVERPRFHAGANLETFNRRLQEWQDKWETQ